MQLKIGFPTFESVIGDPDLIGRWSLTSAADIPNAANASIGANVEFNSTLGVRGKHVGADAAQSILYNGPGAAAWYAGHVELATNRRFIIGMEIHRSAWEANVDALAGTGTVAPIEFRGAVNVGALRFGRSSVVGNAIIDTYWGTNQPGLTNVTAYQSRYFSDKEFIPVIMECGFGRWNLYADKMWICSWPATAWLTTDFDDLYLAGTQNISNSTPPGFPFWMRNLFVLRRVLTLPVDSRFENMLFLGDSWFDLGRPYTGSPLATARIGANSTAGIGPMFQKLLADAGFYIRKINFSASTGARLATGGTNQIIQQVNGSPSGADRDALIFNSRVGFTIIGGNDAIGENTTVETLRTALNAYLDLIEPRLELHFLLNVPDISGGTSIHTPAVALQRIKDINVMFAEEIALRTTTKLLDFYTHLGPYNLDNMKPDTVHLNERLNATKVSPWLVSQSMPDILALPR